MDLQAKLKYKNNKLSIESLKFPARKCTVTELIEEKKASELKEEYARMPTKMRELNLKDVFGYTPMERYRG